MLLLIFVHVRLYSFLEATSRLSYPGLVKVGQINTSTVPRGISMVNQHRLPVVILL